MIPPTYTGEIRRGFFAGEDELFLALGVTLVKCRRSLLGDERQGRCKNWVSEICFVAWCSYK